MAKCFVTFGNTFLLSDFSLSLSLALSLGCVTPLLLYYWNIWIWLVQRLNANVWFPRGASAASWAAGVCRRGGGGGRGGLLNCISSNYALYCLYSLVLNGAGKHSGFASKWQYFQGACESLVHLASSPPTPMSMEGQRSAIKYKKCWEFQCLLLALLWWITWYWLFWWIGALAHIIPGSYTVCVAFTSVRSGMF